MTYIDVIKYTRKCNKRSRTIEKRDHMVAPHIYRKLEWSGHEQAIRTI